MKTILVVEDDLDHQELLKNVFSGLCNVVCAATLRAAQEKVEGQKFDLVLLDIELPDGDGFKLVPHILKKIPILFLTGRPEIDNKLLAFSLGAHDYILKPYDSRELVARVLSHLERDKEDESFRIGDLRLSLPLQKVFVLGKGRESPIQLTSLEFKILLYLAKHEEHVLSRESLIKGIWGDNLTITDRAIDTHISHIRKKLRVSQVKIESVYGEGYRLTSPGV